MTLCKVRTIGELLPAHCSAELESLACGVERDEGDVTGQPSTRLLVNVKDQENEPDPVSLSKLWADYINSRSAAGLMKDDGKRMRPVINSLRKFLGHNDATRVTKKNLLEWRDQLLSTLSPKTVSDIYLSTVRSLFKCAHDNDRLPENPATMVKQLEFRVRTHWFQVGGM